MHQLARKKAQLNFHLFPAIFCIFLADALNKMAYKPEVVTTSRTEWFFILVRLKMLKHTSYFISQACLQSFK
jgi:hypothetical protein